MSVGCQITDGNVLCTEFRPPLRRLHCDQAGVVERNLARTVCQCLCDVVWIKLKASETYGCANSTRFLRRTTHLPWIQGSVAHYPVADSAAYTGDLLHLSEPCRCSQHWLAYYTSLWGPS